MTARRSRRRVIAVLVALAGVAIVALLFPWPMSDDPRARELRARSLARQRLIQAVEDPRFEADPWVLAHGLLLVEPGEELLAAWTDRLDSRWLRRGPDGRVSVPLHGENGRGEQHPHLVLKSLAEVAAESGDARAAALAAELARSAIAGFAPPRTFEEWNDVAWLLHGLAVLARSPGSDLRADTRLGEGEMTLGELALGVLARVEEGDRIVEEALAAEGGFTRPSGDEPPERAGIYAYTCGGQHLLQGVLAAAQAGWIPSAEIPRLEGRIELLVRRLSAEQRFRAAEESRALDAGVSEIRAMRMRVSSDLKLQGHALETLAIAHAALPAMRGSIVAITLPLVRARVRTLLEQREGKVDPEGTVAPRLRAESPPEWELWFGDGAHALHGLRMADSILPPADDP